MIFNTKDYITEAMRQLINEEYCKKVEKDLTPDYEQLINQSTDELISYQRWRHIREGDWPTSKASKLKTPMYMLPKINKPNNPGRPVVSSVNSPTEEQSLCVDVFLRPLAEKLTSHIRDTIDRFYQKITKKLNNFIFSDENLIQVKGTAMGTRAAPNFGDLYMDRLEDRFVYQTETLLQHL